MIKLMVEAYGLRQHDNEDATKPNFSRAYSSCKDKLQYLFIEEEDGKGWEERGNPEPSAL